MIYRKHPIRPLLKSMLRKASIRYPLFFEKYNATENYLLKFLTVSSVSSDSIVKGIIDDIINTAVKTAEVDEQKTKYLQHFINKIKAAFNNNTTALWWPSWRESATAGNNFGRGPSNDYSIKVWF
jgi:hypothetical protein